MKYYSYPLQVIKYLLVVFIAITLAGCNNDDDSPASNAQLPPATQTGAGTLGCYVDGKAFINNDGQMNCYYQSINNKYYFYIQGEDQNNNNPRTITLATEDKTISEGEILQLMNNQPGNAWGGGRFNTSPFNDEGSYTQNENYTGELTITKLDFENFIVSGTFWFDVEHPITGERVEVREGRFDSHFTQ